MQQDTDRDFTYTGYNHQHLDAARRLRREMTPAEKQLWYQYCCKSKHRFYRQRAIGQFIVDFYCPSAKLVIELDGSQHYTKDGKEYDSIRTDILECYHLTVIRFSNDQVTKDFFATCAAINREIERKLSEG